MQDGKKIILTLTVLIVVALWVVLPLRLDIVTPRLGIPVITQAGKEFDIELKSSIPYFFPATKWRLQQGDRQYTLQQTAVHTSFANRQLTVKLPSDIATGAYSLVGEYGDRKRIEHLKSVHIVDSVPEDFSIVQLADLPTLGGNEKGDKLLLQIIAEINIINPNVVLFTGDVAYGGSWDQYRRLEDALAKVDAPVIVVAGNHEYEGWAGYLNYFVKPYHAVDYGRYKFISLNSGHNRDQITVSQYHWLREQLRNLRGKIPIVQLHHPLLHKKGQGGYVQVRAAELVRLFKHYGVPIVLSGHWHGDMVFDEQGNEHRDTWKFPGTPYVTTTTAGADLRPDYSASPLHHGYRLIRMKNAKLISYTYDYDGNGERDAAASIPVGKLNVLYQGNNAIVVKNDLNEALPNAKLKITTSEVDAQWQPTKGKVLRQIESAGKRTYEILIDLPAHSQTNVALTKLKTEAN
jgi:predicted MPP superfamily phosphohydrolase